MPTNRGVWLMAEKDYPMQIKDAPYTPPEENQIVIKSKAWGINPADWIIQSAAPPNIVLEYPAILGIDVAGEVYEVGKNITRFKAGDRVIGGAVTKFAGPSDAHSAFQDYVIVYDAIASHIPETATYEQAVVLPLCLMTASSGMFNEGHLEMQYPSLNPQPTGKTLVVWGAASAVGCNAVQLAVAAGYEVIATASASNFDFIKKLGASEVLDYHNPSIVDEIVAAAKGKDLVGVAHAAGYGDSSMKCAEILTKTTGTKMLSTSVVVSEELQQYCDKNGIKLQWMISTSIKDNAVGPAIFGHFLPEALAKGKYILAPDPKVVGKGLESIQLALDTLKQGVSAQKIVVSA